MDLLFSWCKDNKMHINPQKSGIMVVRKDRRTHEFKTDSWREIPLVNEYKYLGLMITDSLKLLPLYKELQKKEAATLAKLNPRTTSVYDAAELIVIFRTLIESKMTYGLQILAEHDDKIIKW